MNNEEKYKNALAKAREIYRKTNVVQKGLLENLFPELKESEDERIMEELKRAIAAALDYSFFDKESADNCLAWLEKQVEQKSDWSDEDCYKVQRICMYLNEAKKYYADITEVRECIEWLKSLKDRVQPQPKQEWSEEDELNLKGIIDEIEANKNSAPSYDLPTYDKYLNWLKSLKKKIKND